ncbi:MAG: hypothetical protein ACOZF0_03565 [Thermodesulfobacteriota bacterium]
MERIVISGFTLVGLGLQAEQHLWLRGGLLLSCLAGNDADSGLLHQVLGVDSMKDLFFHPKMVASWEEQMLLIKSLSLLFIQHIKR